MVNYGPKEKLEDIKNLGKAYDTDKDVEVLEKDRFAHTVFLVGYAVRKNEPEHTYLLMKVCMTGAGHWGHRGYGWVKVHNKNVEWLNGNIVQVFVFFNFL